MTLSESDESPTYRVTFHGEAENGLNSLPPSKRSKILDFANTVLRQDLKRHIAKQTKKLTMPGEYYQWRVDRGTRLIWLVREENREVRVIHVGPHPEGREYRRLTERSR